MSISSQINVKNRLLGLIIDFSFQVRCFVAFLLKNSVCMRPHHLISSFESLELGDSQNVFAPAVFMQLVWVLD